MKKIASIFLVLVVLLSLTVQTVFAAQGTLELLEARHDVNGSVIFVFQFSGDFKKNDFKGGKVFFDDNKLSMDCSIVDKEEGIVQCTTSRLAAGRNIQINLAGFIFWTFVPLRAGGSGGPSQYCYNVYDIFDEYDSSTEEFLGLFWEAFDVHCQDAPATYGDTLTDFPNPYYGGTYDYQFGPDSPFFPCASNSVVEDAYYYDVSCSEG